MQQSRWEANMPAVSQDFSRILWNQGIYCSAHKIPPPNACREPDKMFLSTPRSAKYYLFIIRSVTNFKKDGKHDVL